MKFIPVAGFLIALIAQYAWSGQIEIWEDDQGVTHIEYHKSNMQKTGLSAPQKYKKSNRQYKNFNQKSATAQKNGVTIIEWLNIA